MKRQIHWGLASVAGTLPLMLVFTRPVLAVDGPATVRRAAADDVSQALQAEIEGKNSRRQGRLDAALEAAPDLHTARWHSGYVWSGNRWLKFDDPAVAGNKPSFKSYVRKREKYRNTVEDQLALANWCKTAGLKDQWRAHLGNVLALNPDQEDARAALGYQLVRRRLADSPGDCPRQVAGGSRYRGAKQVEAETGGHSQRS